MAMRSTGITTATAITQEGDSESSTGRETVCQGREEMSESVSQLVSEGRTEEWRK